MQPISDMVQSTRTFVTGTVTKVRDNRLYQAIVLALVIFILWKYCTCDNPIASWNLRERVCRVVGSSKAAEKPADQEEQ